ncbi:MAG: hypothetical protein QM809_18500 [Gordonia sp. (in: high G+C Gram-positive bacteria)]|uniref:hypothetical protein n=1 Tax=Gordonia sp. (in: high G+C Gram-positive bacteria) TaxID=84139 RepID=UPI0039E615E9
MTSTETPAPAFLRTLDHAVHRNHLKAAGLTLGEIRAAEDAGLIVEFRKEFYGPPSFAALTGRDRLLMAAAAYQRLGRTRDALLTGAAAAALHGMIEIDADSARPRPLEFLEYASDGRSVTRAAAVIRVDRVRDRESVVLDGVETTTPARTLIDMVPTYPHLLDDWVVTADRALRLGIVTRDQLVREAGLLRRRQGDVRVQLERLDERSRSEGETRSRLYFAREGMTRPELYETVYDYAGEPVATPPFVWPRQRVVGFCVEPVPACAFPDCDDRCTGDPGCAVDQHVDELFRELEAQTETDRRLDALGYRVYRWSGSRPSPDCGLCRLREDVGTPYRRVVRPGRFDYF